MYINTLGLDENIGVLIALEKCDIDICNND
jgi:hypothetical protein